MFKSGSMSLSPITRGAFAAVALLLLVTAHLSAQAAAPADAGEDIRPARDPVEIVRPKEPTVALWLGLGGGALVLALAALWWHKHRRRQRLKSPPEVALAALAELAARREVMAAEAFAYLAAQAVRQYIADRFGLAAPRRTTEEFLHDLVTGESAPLLGQSDHLRVFLKACDLAKFAASPLDGGQRGELLQAARGFIAATAAPVSNAKRKSVTS